MINPKKFWTHCMEGHEFTNENTIIKFYKGKSYRRCKTCKQKRQREYNIKNKKIIDGQERNYWPAWAEKTRRIVLTHYGKDQKLVCVCCGEDTFQFLTLDHINNDGQEERRKYGNGLNIMRKLIVKGFPPTGYQTLCWNCNLGKRSNKGICPHKSFYKSKIPITVEWQS